MREKGGICTRCLQFDQCTQVQSSACPLQIVTVDAGWLPLRSALFSFLPQDQTRLGFDSPGKQCGTNGLDVRICAVEQVPSLH